MIRLTYNLPDGSGREVTAYKDHCHRFGDIKTKKAAYGNELMSCCNLDQNGECSDIIVLYKRDIESLSLTTES